MLSRLDSRKLINGNYLAEIERPSEALGLSRVSPDRPLIGSGCHFYDSESRLLSDVYVPRHARYL